MNAPHDAIEREHLPLAAILLIRPAYPPYPDAQFMLSYLFFSSADVDLAQPSH